MATTRHMQGDVCVCAYVHTRASIRVHVWELCSNFLFSSVDTT